MDTMAADRTFQSIWDEAASTRDPVKLWSLSQEIGEKYKRNADKMVFAYYTKGGVVDADDWFRNKEPTYRRLCNDVARMTADAISGMSTEEILDIVQRAKVARWTVPAIGTR